MKKTQNAKSRIKGIEETRSKKTGKGARPENEHRRKQRKQKRQTKRKDRQRRESEGILPAQRALIKSPSFRGFIGNINRRLNLAENQVRSRRCPSRVSSWRDKGGNGREEEEGREEAKEEGKAEMRGEGWGEGGEGEMRGRGEEGEEEREGAKGKGGGAEIRGERDGGGTEIKEGEG